ncbi:exonuclease RNase T and DNA polymerase III [Flammeovirgaceae bacterium 311]|nr:exonuclease RNase T and DNA polymerase III [Flammeovirgaceae bacterium 311]
MKEYLLFVDTETSGLPKDWNKPYSAVGNWPYIVQLAWVVYTREGEEVKQENHYIKPLDYGITDVSREIHGISDEYLMEHGKARRLVMQQLHKDLLHYQPLIVGHFMQLDYHMMGLGFYRAGLSNPLTSLPTFCTMQLTHNFYRESGYKYMRLEQLYLKLFGTKLEQQHDALVDATATARCFFELWRRGEITESVVARQRQSYALKEKEPTDGAGRRIMIFLVLASLALLLYFFFK